MTPEARQKAESAGWKFSYTTVLEQTYAARKTERGTELNFEDGVYYSQQEVRNLNHMSVKINRRIHAVKKVFGGVIVEVREAAEVDKGPERAAEPAGKPEVRQVPLF